MADLLGVHHGATAGPGRKSRRPLRASEFKFSIFWHLRCAVIIAFPHLCETLIFPMHASVAVQVILTDGEDGDSEGSERYKELLDVIRSPGFILRITLVIIGVGTTMQCQTATALAHSEVSVFIFVVTSSSAGELDGHVRSITAGMQEPTGTCRVMALAAHVVPLT